MKNYGSFDAVIDGLPRLLIELVGPKAGREEPWWTFEPGNDLRVTLNGEPFRVVYDIVMPFLKEVAEENPQEPGKWRLLPEHLPKEEKPTLLERATGRRKPRPKAPFREDTAYLETVYPSKGPYLLSDQDRTTLIEAGTILSRLADKIGSQDAQGYAKLLSLHAKLQQIACKRHPDAAQTLPELLAEVL